MYLIGMSHAAKSMALSASSPVPLCYLCPGHASILQMSSASRFATCMVYVLACQHCEDATVGYHESCPLTCSCAAFQWSNSCVPACKTSQVMQEEQ